MRIEFFVFYGIFLCRTGVAFDSSIFQLSIVSFVNRIIIFTDASLKVLDLRFESRLQLHILTDYKKKYDYFAMIRLIHVLELVLRVFMGL